MADVIRQRILSGDLEIGGQLPNELDLSAQYGVSRAVVREAIRVLVQEGLVEVRRGLGTFAIDGTSDALKGSLGLIMSFNQSEGGLDLVEVREVLEPEIAAKAAKRATPEEIDTLRAIVQSMDDNIDDADAFVRQDLAFHLTLAQATHNVLFPKLIEPIVDLLFEQRKGTFQVSGSATRGQIHHRQIFEAVLRRDPEAARRAMQDHLAQVRRDQEESN
jgi:GntR family transcriptional repressor for pyruvate dehydrogenase complex